MLGQNKLQKERNQKLLQDLILLPGNSKLNDIRTRLGSCNFSQIFVPIVEVEIRNGHLIISVYLYGKVNLCLSLSG